MLTNIVIGFVFELFLMFLPVQLLEILEILEICCNLKSILEILEIYWDLICPAGKIIDFMRLCTFLNGRLV